MPSPATSGAGRGAKVPNLYCEVNENIKAYGYERTSFNADDDRVAEKEIRDDFAR